MLENKKLFLLFVFLVFSLIFIETVNAGCCIFQQDSRDIPQDISEEGCDVISFGVYNESSCSVIESQGLGCCCREAGDIYIAYELWCDAKGVDFNPDISTEAECEEFCSQTQLCEYSSCQEPNEIGCQCGNIQTETGKLFCNGAESEVFSTRDACLDSIGYVMVYGYVKDSDSRNALNGISVSSSSGTETDVTDDSGNYAIFLLGNQGNVEITASGVGCEDSKIIYIENAPKRVDFELTGCRISDCDYFCDWENEDEVEYRIDENGECTKTVVCTSSSVDCLDDTRTIFCCQDGFCDITDDIEGADIYNECYACPMDCTSGECECEPGKPEINYTRYTATNKVYLQWGFDDSCKNFNSYALKINIDEWEWRVLEPVVLSYADNSYTYNFTESGIGHCFMVTAYLNDGTHVNSTPKCLNSNNRTCWDKTPETFCINDSIARCNNENQLLLQECPSDDFCIGPNQDGVSFCAITSVCDDCNGVYGMFGYTGMMIYGFNITDPDNPEESEELDPFSCEDLIKGDVPELLDNMCIYDQTKTTVDKYKECSSVLSCYDYSSEYNCLDNPCNITMECTWNFGISEFGTGVCSPQDDGFQECGLCDEQLEACDWESCQFYGNCYYTINEECVHRNDVHCALYRSKDHCISIEGSEEEFSLDTETNEVTGTSNDFFGFKKCQWVESKNKCIKNSDDDIINTPEDCSLGIGRLECLKDVTSPKTTLKLRDPPKYWFPDENFNLNYAVWDDTYSEERIDTYFCIVKEGDNNNCYPYVNKEDYTDDVRELINEVKSPGTYTVYYYSKDPSENLEKIKSAEIEFKNEDYPEIKCASFI